MFLIKTTLNHQLHSWLFKLYWLKHYLTAERIEHALVATFIAYTGIVAVQFAYPAKLAMPAARLSGKYVGFHSQKSIQAHVNSLKDQPIYINIEGQTLIHKLTDIGLSLDGQATATQTANYSWRNRLIPFSLFFTRRNVDSYIVSTDDKKVEAFAASLAQYDKKPINSLVKIENTAINVEPAQNGYTYSSEKVMTKLKDPDLNDNLKINVTPTTITPAIGTNVAEDAAKNIKQRLNIPFTISAAGETLIIDAPTLASWVTTTPEPDSKAIKVSYDRAKIKAKLMTLSSKIYIAETPNRVSMLDGEVTSKAGGANGLALQMDASIDEIIAAANANASLVVAKTQPVTPSTEIARSYTRSTKGLQTLIDYWAKTHGGQFGIVLKDLNGSIAASYNPNKQFTSASIYKLYVAYAVYTKILAGQMSLDDTTSTGASVGSCIDVMIVRSDNPCAVALGSAVGWANNNPMLHSKGFTSTSLGYGGQLTTASDAATWLWQVQTGTLTSNDFNSHLLSLMSRQIYRSGIPAGSAGSVADKVGFLGGLNHDAAIVYHPKGTYVLVVMSSGSSFGNIADLARQISNVMSQ